MAFRSIELVQKLEHLKLPLNMSSKTYLVHDYNENAAHELLVIKFLAHSAHTSLSVFILVHISLNQFTSVHISFHQFILVHIGSYQFILVHISSYQFICKGFMLCLCQNSSAIAALLILHHLLIDDQRQKRPRNLYALVLSLKGVTNPV